MTVNKCTKKRDARAKLLFCLFYLLSLTLPSWHLKIPISNPGRGGGGRYTAVKGMVFKQCDLGERIEIRELGSKI